MKKLLAILAVAGVMAACNNGNDETSNADSLNADSMNGGNMSVTSHMSDTSHMMGDTSHMSSDTTRK
jgi:uncharacterized lipoprotein YajG